MWRPKPTSCAPSSRKKTQKIRGSIRPRPPDHPPRPIMSDRPGGRPIIPPIMARSSAARQEGPPRAGAREEVVRRRWGGEEVEIKGRPRTDREKRPLPVPRPNPRRPRERATPVVEMFRYRSSTFFTSICLFRHRRGASMGLISAVRS